MSEGYDRASVFLKDLIRDVEDYEDITKILLNMLVAVRMTMMLERDPHGLEALVGTATAVLRGEGNN